MTKYIITDDYRLYKTRRSAADFAPDHILVHKNMTPNSVLKIFSNPITAIAYDYNRPQELGNEYEMDKKDIIKALDFWINDKILENEKLLKLNNRLEDFNETELKTLIRIKDTVLKMDIDTKFKRFDKNHYSSDYNMLCSDNVEFWYEIKKAPERNHRHVSMISTTETERNRTIRGIIQPEPPITWERVTPTTSGAYHIDEFMGYFRYTLGSVDDETSGVMHGGRHSDGSSSLSGNRITRVDVQARRTGTPSGSVTTRVRAPAPSTDPNTWTVHRMGDNRSRWLVRDPSGRTVVDNFLSESGAYVYIESSKEHFLPSQIGEPQGTLVNNSVPTVMIGTAGENLRAGDLLVRDENTGRHIKANDTSRRSTHIVVNSVREGERVEAVTEGTFMYPPGYTPVLRPGDSVTTDEHGNVMVTRTRDYPPPPAAPSFEREYSLSYDTSITLNDVRFETAPTSGELTNRDVAQRMTDMSDSIRGDWSTMGTSAAHAFSDLTTAMNSLGLSTPAEVRSNVGLPSNTAHMRFENMYIDSISFHSAYGTELVFRGESGAEMTVKINTFMDS